MSVRVEIGQIWEEVDARRARRRQFVIVEFLSDLLSYVGCIRYFGTRGDEFAPNPTTGRKPRRFQLYENELNSPKYNFTGTVVSIPLPSGDYPPTKSYGL